MAYFLHVVWFRLVLSGSGRKESTQIRNSLCLHPNIFLPFSYTCIYKLRKRIVKMRNSRVPLMWLFLYFPLLQASFGFHSGGKINKLTRRCQDVCGWNKLTTTKSLLDCHSKSTTICHSYIHSILYWLVHFNIRRSLLWLYMGNYKTLRHF